MVHHSRVPRRSDDVIEAAAERISTIMREAGIDRHERRGTIKLLSKIGRRKGDLTLVDIEKRFGPIGVNIYLKNLMDYGVVSFHDVLKDGTPQGVTRWKE